MELIIVTITGCLMGFVNAFFGVGGGSVMLPIFYSAFAYMTPALAIPISLGAIFLNSLSNSYRYYKSGIFPLARTVWIFIVSGIFGTVLGTAFIHAVEPGTAKRFLGIVMCAVTLRIIFSKQHLQEQSTLKEPAGPMALACFLSSALSAMTGLGGGIVLVPVFIAFLKMPLKYVTPFSNVAMTVSSLIGLIPYIITRPDLSSVPTHLHPYYFGSVNLVFVAILFIGGLYSSKLGVKWNNTIGPRHKKILLVTYMSVVSLKVVFS